MPPPEPHVAKQPTTRMIAALAGISKTAVSMALRHHPKISAATRNRVHKIAARLGYRPDPHVAKLMHHLRLARKPRFQSLICALTTMEDKSASYMSAIAASARTRADALGYGFTVMQVEDRPGRRPDLHRILRSRGVEGLLLLPMQTPHAFDDLIDWRDFSVLAATYAVLSPEFHRVVPHQFGNMLLVCHELARRGYRRIGLVLDKRQDLRVHHHFSAAVAWQSLLGGTELVRPLIHDTPLPAGVSEWFERERPDAIIAGGQADGESIAHALGLRIPGPVGFVLTDRSETALFAGIDQRPADIGARATEILSGMIQRGEKGAPAVPTVTMIEGRWVAGKSISPLATGPHRATPGHARPRAPVSVGVKRAVGQGKR
jgi:DNA-binding LacI/PurR family transcriptional regulator